MKKIPESATLVVILIMLLVSSACKKYEDGPWFSIYSKTERVAGNWRFELVRIDGVNKTDEYSDQQVRISRNGDLYWVQGYLGSYWETYGPGGEWRFINNKTQVEMHFVHGVEEEYKLIWDIIRLAYADLQLERYEDGKKIEWKMWKY